MHILFCRFCPIPFAVTFWVGFLCKRHRISRSIGAASVLESVTLPAVSEEDYCGYYGNFYRVEEINKHVILYTRHLLTHNSYFLNIIHFLRIYLSVVTFLGVRWRNLICLLSTTTKLSYQKKDDGWKNGVKRWSLPHSLSDCCQR